MERYFYLKDGTEVQGPIALDDLQHMAAQGILPPATQVCLEGTQTWQPITAVAMVARVVLQARRAPAAQQPLRPRPRPTTKAGPKKLIPGQILLVFLCLAIWWCVRQPSKTTSSPRSSSSSRYTSDSTSSSGTSYRSSTSSTPSLLSREMDDGLNKGYFGGQEAARAGFPVPTAENLHDVALRLARDAGVTNTEEWTLSFERGFAAGYKDASKKAF